MFFMCLADFFRLKKSRELLHLRSDFMNFIWVNCVMKLLFLSSHKFDSSRKAGFHHVASNMSENGCEVYFVTVPSSFISFLRARSGPFECWRRIKSAFKSIKFQGVTCSSYFSLLHPPAASDNFSSRILNIFFRMGYCRYFRNDYTHIVIESGVGISLVKRLKKLNPKSKMVYRASDDLTSLTENDFIIEMEESNLKHFDLISTCSTYNTKRLQHHANIPVQTIYNGISKELFDQPNIIRPSTYDSESKNVVFIGSGHVDWNFISVASLNFPEIIFHIIGPIEQRVLHDNIIYYGEIVFADTVPYLKYADIGLLLKTTQVPQAYERPLKLLQYTYCHLPIIGQAGLGLQDDHFIPFRSDKESIIASVRKALNYPRENIRSDWIGGWHEVSKAIIRV